MCAGTALYGCHPELIRARRTRMSYGIRQAAPYTQGAPGKFFNEEEGCFWTDSVYAKMVDRGQEVRVCVYRCVCVCVCVCVFVRAIVHVQPCTH